MARKSEYDFEMCKEICDSIANGMNIKQVLKSKKEYPDWSTFRRWKLENDELHTLYTRSIQDKAEMVACEIDEIALDVRNKVIDNHVGRLLIDTLKWKAAKFYPKMFGDQSKITLDGGINVTNKQDYSEYSTEDLEIIANISKKYEKKKD